MAIYQTSGIQTGDTPSRSRQDGQHFVDWFSIVVPTATITPTPDVYELCRVPARARVIDWWLQFTAAVDSGTALRWKLGTDEKDDALGAGLEFGDSVNLLMRPGYIGAWATGFLVPTFLYTVADVNPVTPGAEQKLKLTCVAAAGTLVPGATLNGFISFSMNP